MIKEHFFEMVSKEHFIDIMNIYFKRFTDAERFDARRDFLIQANTKMLKKWSIAEKTEIPELHHLIRDDFFMFLAINKRMGV